MTILDGFLISFVALIFMGLFVQEKDFIFKWLFFFVGLSMITIAFLVNTVSNVQVTNTTIPSYSVNYKTISQCTLNSTVGYEYFYLDPTNSMYNLTDSFYELDTKPYGTFTNLTFKLPPASGHYKIAQFITNAIEPNQNVYPKGLYQVHIHAGTNDTTSTVHLYSQLWAIGANDNNLFMIGETPLSQALQQNDTEYLNNFFNNQTFIFNKTDRLALFVFANYTASFGSPANVSLYIGQSANPHVSIPEVSNSTCLSTNDETVPSYTSNSVISSVNNNDDTSIGKALAIMDVLILLYFAYLCFTGIYAKKT